MGEVVFLLLVAGFTAWLGFSAGQDSAAKDVCAAIYGHEPKEMVFKDNHCVLKSETALEMTKP